MNFSGTQSAPPAENGLHLAIRHNAKQPPLTAPNLEIAVTAYSEQLGVKRQRGGRIFDSVSLYSLIIPIKIYFKSYSCFPAVFAPEFRSYRDLPAFVTTARVKRVFVSVRKFAGF